MQAKQKKSLDDCVAELRRLRMERADRMRDEAIREQLGLRYVGLYYPQFGRDPVQLYVGVDGVQYVRRTQFVYRPLHSEIVRFDAELLVVG